MTEIYASPGQMTTLEFHLQSTVPLEETEKTLRKEEDGTELKLSIGSGGSLIYTFDDPGVDDTGTYTCIVSNRIGKDTAVLKLVIGIICLLVLYVAHMLTLVTRLLQSPQPNNTKSKINDAL